MTWLNNVWNTIKLKYIVHCLKFWIRLIKLLRRFGLSYSTIDKLTFELSVFLHGCYWYLVPSLFIFGALI